MRVVREGPTRITRTTIDAAWRRRAPESRLVIGDHECRGLALVVNSTAMAWRYDYKPRGLDPITGKRFATRSVTIGNPETHSPDAARTEANRLKGEAKAGKDPAAERKASVASSALKRGRTMGRLVEDYAKALPGRPKLRGAGLVSQKHAAEETAHLRAAVMIMKAGDRPAADISAMDLRGLLRASAAQPATSRARFGALSRFFDWCQDEGLVQMNPCALVAKARRPKPLAARSHYLHPAELALLWKAAAESTGLQQVHRDLIQFLIAIPARRNEAACMDWAHLDLQAAVWSQPADRTKNGDPHRVHLHSLARDILHRRHAAAGAPPSGLVFPAPKSGGVIDTFSDMKAALVAASGLNGWRWHDLRRSFATALGEAGVDEAIADAILNHRQAATRGGVLGVYQRAQRWPEQQKIMGAWGRLLDAAISGNSGCNIIDFAATRSALVAANGA